MQQLEVFATTPFYTNVAMNRGTVSAIELQEMVLNQLVAGVAVFSFLKTDGVTTRNAIGTLNSNIIPAKQIAPDTIVLSVFKGLVTADSIIKTADDDTEATSQDLARLKDVEEWAKIAKETLEKYNKPTKEKAKSPDTQVYFDIQEQAWKSYRIDNLIALTLH